VVRLRLRLLRDRPDDLAALVSAFAARYENVYRPIASVEEELVAFLRTHAFSGNVRELENAVVRMLFAKKHGTSLGLEDWFAQAGEEKPEAHRDLIGEAAENLWQSISGSGLSYAEAIETLEKKILATALVAGGRTRREVAKKLRTSERTLYHMMRTHGLRGQRIA
jgi:two-component system, NtrC family, response regulator AtoC